MSAETGRGGHGWSTLSTGHVGPAFTAPYTPEVMGDVGGELAVGEVAVVVRSPEGAPPAQPTRRRQAAVVATTTAAPTP